jgi:hypothetical protein
MQLYIGAEHFSKDDLLVFDLPLLGGLEIRKEWQQDRVGRSFVLDLPLVGSKL